MQMHMPLFAKYFIFVSILLYFQDISSTSLLFLHSTQPIYLDAGSPFLHQKASGLARLREKLFSYLFSLDD